MGRRLRKVCKEAKTDKQNTYFKGQILNRAGIYTGVSISAASLLSCLGFKKKIETKVKITFFDLFSWICVTFKMAPQWRSCRSYCTVSNRVSLLRAHQAVLRSFPQNALRSTCQGAPRKANSSPFPNPPPSTSF